MRAATIGCICLLLLSLVGGWVGADTPNVISLEWDAVSHPKLAFYRVYWTAEGDATLHSADVPANTTEVVLTNLPCTLHNWIVVRSVSTEGIESGDSNVVSGNPTVTGATAECIPAPKNLKIAAPATDG